jgi:hypothetical protein
MPEKSTYRHAIKSMTSSTNAAPAAGKGFGAPMAGEGSGAVDITMSRSLTDGGGGESPSEGTITTSAPLEPAPAGGSNDDWGGPLHGRLSLLNGGGGHWRGRRT